MTVEALRTFLPDPRPLFLFMGRRLREALLLLILGLGLLALMALATYSPADPGWSFTGHAAQVENQAGWFGAWFADIFFYLFGLGAYLVPLTAVWLAWDYLNPSEEEPLIHHLSADLLRWGGMLLTLWGGSAYAAAQLSGLALSLPTGSGGVLGQLLAAPVVAAFGTLGGSLVLLLQFSLGVTLLTGLSWFVLMERIGGATLWLGRHLFGGAVGGLLSTSARRRSAVPEGVDEREEVRLEEALSEVAHEPLSHRVEPSLRAGPVVEPEPEQAATAEERVGPSPSLLQMLQQKEPELSQPIVPKPAAKKSVPPLMASGERLPALDLLEEAPPRVGGYSQAALDEMSLEVEARLKDYNVTAEVVAVHPGPVVTLFELQLAPGTKASKVTGLSNDLARSLSTSRVRVVEVIPGKTTIGLEIPNEKRETVYLSEIIGASVYQDASSQLTLSLGKDIGGNPVVADLAKMPHALIAGTTGSGKSVAINAMILSLLYKAGPEDVRLIMVDPKMLELSVYEGIPHLLTPVVTDMKEAANALRWCVAEMERRYKLMASQGVRNIKGFNSKVEKAIEAGEPIPDPFFDPAQALAVEAHPTLEKMPYIVVVIDELADMMMVVGKKVEELIARLAQKARAAGIHLLLATQRPSVDVITGLIKANIPTRLSFQVSSRIDSRTILDQMGAENLLGHGDGLYLAPGGSVVKRVHGAFVDDHEVHAVVEFLKTTGEPNYLDEILQEPSEAIPGLSPEAAGVDVEDADPLFDEAVEFVLQSRRASISSVQRRLKIGYNRAARLVEEMERVGLVSPPEHNGNRTVLAPAPNES